MTLRIGILERHDVNTGFLKISALSNLESIGKTLCKRNQSHKGPNSNFSHIII